MKRDGGGRVKVSLGCDEKPLHFKYPSDITDEARDALMAAARRKLEECKRGRCSRDNVRKHLEPLFPDTTPPKERHGRHAATHAHPASGLQLEKSLEYWQRGWTVVDPITEYDRQRLWKIHVAAFDGRY